jgi:hypothetical protein
MADKDRDRYCTPPPIARRIRRQWRMGADTDPCYDPQGARLAQTLYDIRQGQDGLVLPWYGKVWLNPPYSAPAPWLKRAALHYLRGHGEVLAIVNVQSATRYWHQWVWPVATAICFLDHRVDFLYEGVPEKGNRDQQAILYYGDDLAGFYRACGSAGVIVRPPRHPLTAEWSRAMLAAMMDGQQTQPPEEPQENFDLVKVLGPAIVFTIYSRVKHLTIEDVVDRLLPFAEDFIAGFQYGRATAVEGEVTFDDGEPPEDHPQVPAAEPAAPTGRKRAKKSSKKSSKKKAKKKVSRATTKGNGPAADAPAMSTAQLDQHVLSLLQGRGQWTASRELAPYVPGVNDNKLRKSLARLEGAGSVVSQGRTKSKSYMATGTTGGG